MDRTFRPLAGALENDVILLYGSITIGASGAVSASSGKGIDSVARASAGQYTITLEEPVGAFLWAGFQLLDATAESPALVGTEMRLEAQDVTAATPTVTLQCYAADDGADTDPADGAVIYFCLHLRNSTVS